MNKGIEAEMTYLSSVPQMHLARLSNNEICLLVPSRCIAGNRLAFRAKSNCAHCVISGEFVALQGTPQVDPPPTAEDIEGHVSHHKTNHFVVGETRTCPLNDNLQYEETPKPKGDTYWIGCLLSSS